MFLASLLHPLSSPPPPPFLSGCRVMYGPRQHWDQWDASCFNLAPEPGRSRSGASWKSDDTGLSPPPCTPCLPPTPLLPCAGWINAFLLLVSIWRPRRGGELTFRWTEDVLHRYHDSASYRASPAPPLQGSRAGQLNPLLIHLRIDPNQPDRRITNSSPSSLAAFLGGSAVRAPSCRAHTVG